MSARAELFIKSIQHYESDKYAVAILELILGRLILTSITSYLQEDEMIREAIYYDMWEKIKDLLEGIRIKTKKNKEEKKKVYAALLELLKPYSERHIGKQVHLDEIYDELVKAQRLLD